MSGTADGLVMLIISVSPHHQHCDVCKNNTMEMVSGLSCHLCLSLHYNSFLWDICMVMNSASHRVKRQCPRLGCLLL
jgi:hypothetical protein